MTRLCATEGCDKKVVYRTRYSRRSKSNPEHDLCEKCWRAAYQSAQQENRERISTRFQPLSSYESK